MEIYSLLVTSCKFPPRGNLTTPTVGITLWEELLGQLSGAIIISGCSERRFSWCKNDEPLHEKGGGGEINQTAYDVGVITINLPLTNNTIMLPSIRYFCANML